MTRTNTEDSKGREISRSEKELSAVLPADIGRERNQTRKLSCFSHWHLHSASSVREP
ncbi:hypothetical protein IJ103_03780 [Candidatus Saccharibacteria bacterium]|nr:hypothetical protein [Candidatus Saccharibacteria bacterium]